MSATQAWKGPERAQQMLQELRTRLDGARNSARWPDIADALEDFHQTLRMVRSRYPFARATSGANGWLRGRQGLLAFEAGTMGASAPVASDRLPAPRSPAPIHLEPTVVEVAATADSPARADPAPVSSDSRESRLSLRYHPWLAEASARQQVHRVG